MVDEVECVVAAGDEIGDKDEDRDIIGGEQLNPPAAEEKGEEKQTSVHRHRTGTRWLSYQHR